MDIDFNEYQKKAKETAVYPDFSDLIVGRLISEGFASGVGYTEKALKIRGEVTPEVEQLAKQFNAILANPYYPALGLAGEVGEFCNKLKKVMRDNNGVITPEFLEFAKGELGDILWYVSALCSELGLSLADVAAGNLEKLASRKERGKLQGNGDAR